MGIQLSDAIDRDLATLACNERPKGWRVADFGDIIAYASPSLRDSRALRSRECSEVHR